MLLEWYMRWPPNAYYTMHKYANTHQAECLVNTIKCMHRHDCQHIFFYIYISLYDMERFQKCECDETYAIKFGCNASISELEWDQ